MNDVRTVAELERTLKTTDPEQLQPARLQEIRTRGGRRRRTRLALVAAGTAAVIVMASLGGAALSGIGEDRAEDAQPASPKPPKEMSALAKRALAEIPGAQQVSSWQVLLPTPVGAPGVPSEQSVSDDLVDAGPIDIGTRHYTGVTAYGRKAFPAWLYDGVSDYEQNVLGSKDEGYPVGSTDIGVVVDGGPMRLVCMRPLPEWGGEPAGDTCFPAMVGEPTATASTSGEWAPTTSCTRARVSSCSRPTTTSTVRRAVWIGGPTAPTWRRWTSSTDGTTSTPRWPSGPWSREHDVLGACRRRPRRGGDT